MAGTANERDFSQGQRDSMAGKKQAMPDGSFPINNRQDLLNAIKLVGRAKNPAAAKAHIKRRAKALGLTNLLPGDWKSASSSASESVGQFTGADVVTAPVLGFYADEGIKATADAPPKFAEVVIIRPGQSANRRNYRTEAIQQAVNEGLWNGARMFKDHNVKAPLERKTDELVARIVPGSVRVGQADEVDADGNSLQGAAIGRGKFFSPSFASFAFESDGALGVSSSHQFQGRRYRAADHTIHEEVDRFLSVNSVDWVPFPAAGGQVLGFASEGRETMDWNDLTVEALREHRSDLIDAIVETASEGEEDVSGDADETDEQPVITAGMSKTEIEALVAQSVKTATEAIETRHTKTAEATRKIRALVSASGLPAKAQERIVAQFDGAEEFVEGTVQEAITDMQAVIAEVKPPRVTGLGSSTGTASESQQVTVAALSPAHSALERAFGIKKQPVATGQEGAK